MSSYMNVQRIATQRNSLAEMLIDFTLQRFVEKMLKEKLITEASETETQKDFIREDCSDCYDHYLRIRLSPKLDPECRWLDIWGQTTCYKGNPSGKPESNKTYEIRETLSEALTLRKWLRREGAFFRTFHFTLGPSQYTYGWFKSAKENAFDLSIYPEIEPGIDIFDEMLNLANGIVYQYEFTEKLSDLMDDGNNPLCNFVNRTVCFLCNYFINGYKSCKMANMQSDLLESIYENTKQLSQNCIESSVNSGMNIKGKSVALLHGETIDDPILMVTLQRILTNNPFLKEALIALSDWSVWTLSAFHRQTQNESLLCYMKDLWSDNKTKKYVIRRLMLRAYTTQSINYIQDVNVPGIDEHNLYSGTHSEAQVERICLYLIDLYNQNGIISSDDLFKALSSVTARALVNSSLKFEGINGTSLKPSFYYLEEFLKPDYALVSFADTNLPLPIGYYVNFADDLNIQPYDNLKVIQRVSTKENIAIIKGKFFRQPEFPRRVKEEAYVGVTTSYTLENNVFVSRYPGKPLIMFIDMQNNWTPPSFAVKRLIGYGWHPFFELSQLKGYLDTLSDGGNDENM